MCRKLDINRWNKTAALYASMFQTIKNSCAQAGLNLAPQEIISDFESAIIPVIAQEFPATRHRGCHFHFCQVNKELHAFGDYWH